MKQEMMEIVQQKQLAPKIFEMTLKGDLVKEMKQPGQFLHILAVSFIGWKVRGLESSLLFLPETI